MVLKKYEAVYVMLSNHMLPLRCRKHPPLVQDVVLTLGLLFLLCLQMNPARRSTFSPLFSSNRTYSWHRLLGETTCLLLWLLRSHCVGDGG